MIEASHPKSKSKSHTAAPANTGTAAPITARVGPNGRVTALTCTLLLIAFGVTAWAAIRTKCATYDEPLHSMGAYMLSQYGDTRVNPEDPPLWQWWVSLAIHPGELKLNFGDPMFGMTPGVEAARWRWVTHTLYGTPGNDPDAFIMKVRTMLILLGVALGGVIAWWSWRLTGGVAAITAVVLFALDPNFLAHAAVVKNDVAISLVGTSLALATWYAGRRLTRANALAVILLGAAAIVTKFSGPLLLLALAATLAVRVALPLAWPCDRWALTTRRARAGAAALLLLVAGLVSYFAIWACYDFRYAVSRDGTVWNTEPLLQSTAINEIRLRDPQRESYQKSEVDQEMAHPAMLVAAMTYCDEHHLLPDSFCYGMIYVYRSSRIRDAFLLNQHSIVGFRSYFPLAFLFKTPVATLLTFAAAAAVGVGALFGWRRRRRSTDAAERASVGVATVAPALWSVACIAVPFAIVGYADLHAKLNIGLRHILPLYPFLFIAAGCAAAQLWRRWGRNGRAVFAGLAAALLIETAAAFPNYIAFFNRAVGGTRNGINLLSDSNLDWGQDLPLLAKWQREHPDKKLYMHYFGTADPAHYGIKYALLLGFQPPPGCAPTASYPPGQPGVIAISATYLQGVYIPEPIREAYEEMRKNNTPFDVLGGTIYLFNYDPSGDAAK